MILVYYYGQILNWLFRAYLLHVCSFFATLVMKSEAEWNIKVFPVLMPLACPSDGKKCSSAPSSCFLLIFSVFTSDNSCVYLKECIPCIQQLNKQWREVVSFVSPCPLATAFIRSSVKTLSICKLCFVCLLGWLLLFFLKPSVLGVQLAASSLVCKIHCNVT